jgi:DNA-binding transcriptional LysR family regulator
MELRHIRYFTTIAQQRSFTRAASLLHIAQPSLSQQMQQLERELGILLLRRTKRSVELTPAGETFLAHAERIIEAVDQARYDMRQYSGRLTGTVTLGTLTSLSILRMPALLRQFRQQYPDVGIVLREATTQRLVELLRAGQIDSALICMVNGHKPAALDDPFFSTEEVFREELGVLVAAGHPLAQQESVTMQALHAHPVVAMNPGTGLRTALDIMGQRTGLPIPIAYESSDINTTSALVAEGLGVALMPFSAVDSQTTAVCWLPFQAPAPFRSIQFVIPARRPLSPPTAAWTTFFRGSHQPVSLASLAPRVSS